MSNLIIKTIDKLRSEKFYGCDELIEIAKGKHEMTTNFGIGFRKLQRKYYQHGNREKN